MISLAQTRMKFIMRVPSDRLKKNYFRMKYFLFIITLYVIQQQKEIEQLKQQLKKEGR
jgi:hypothetical protein